MKWCVTKVPDWIQTQDVRISWWLLYCKDNKMPSLFTSKNIQKTVVHSHFIIHVISWLRTFFNAKSGGLITVTQQPKLTAIITDSILHWWCTASKADVLRCQRLSLTAYTDWIMIPGAPWTWHHSALSVNVFFFFSLVFFFSQEVFSLHLRIYPPLGLGHMELPWIVR